MFLQASLACAGLYDSVAVGNNFSSLGFVIDVRNVAVMYPNGFNIRTPLLNLNVTSSCVSGTYTAANSGELAVQVTKRRAMYSA